MNQERRKFYRHPVNVPIQFQEVRAGKPDRTISVDLSEGGICFLADHFIAKGSGVQLTIAVENERFKISGNVAYCNREAHTGRYRTGVVFQDATNAFRAKLAEEMLKIKEYREKISGELGHEISQEEAAAGSISPPPAERVSPSKSICKGVIVANSLTCLGSSDVGSSSVAMLISGFQIAFCSLSD